MPRSALAEVLPFFRSQVIKVTDALGITTNGAYSTPSASVPSVVGMEATGLTVTCDSDTEIDISYDRLVLINSSGALTTVESATGSIDVTTEGAGGLDYSNGGSPVSSTRHYVYVIYNSNTDTKSAILSRYSDRVPGVSAVNLPSGYDYWREVGECYVDSSGDLVHFKRTGDRVTFDDYADGVIFSSAQVAAAYTGFDYPSCAPARAEGVELAFRSSYTAGVNNVNVVYADDSSGNGATFQSGYAENNAAKTLDGFRQSMTHNRRPADQGIDSNQIFFRWHGSGSSLFISDLYLTGYTWGI